ncbi:MAG: DNA replication/repair protein RecF [Gammaproteobacteria bacterium]|nr:DNA replication/repair protein RecF [Gammaproteobacteria bacterium]
MWFQRLEIQDLRNLASVAVDLGPGLNYFYGPNGAGKTAVLEAVHLLARGRSFRTQQFGDVIRRDQQALLVRAVVRDEHRGEQRLGVSRGRTGRTELRINGETERRLSQAAELLPLQVMVPALSDLVFGGPNLRRQWLDWGLFHVEHGYLKVLRSYLHALRQRNAALKAMAAGRLLERGLDVWTEEVANLAEAVTEAREAYLDALTDDIRSVMSDLAPSLDVAVTYQRGWPAGQSIRKVLGDSLPREVKWGATQSGPHRGDVRLRVAGLDAGSTLSRGQGKSLACGMMLAQARQLRKTAKRSSVFLIDDIGAELDVAHSDRFFGLLKDQGSQVLATSSEAPGSLAGVPEMDTVMFHVEHGEVRPTR